MHPFDVGNGPGAVSKETILTAVSLASVGPFGDASVLEVAQRIRRRETTALEVTEQSLEAVNEYGTELNCFITVDPEGARRAARDADRELALGHDLGPLHGIPVGVKDLMATSGLRTTMGSRHFAHHVPDADADAVMLLRRSGAVILGKTHTHEFAFGPTGDRAFTGPALNPLDTSRITGGSSSGSAAAVAAGLVPIALGSDAAGSVRIPGALCGVVGLRPTAGLVSVEGGFPLSHSLDVVSPLARTVSDTAVAWWALSTKTTQEGIRRPIWSPSLLPDPGRAAQLRISEVKCDLTERVASSTQVEALQFAIETLTDSGASMSETCIPEVDECAQPHQNILFAEAYAIHETRVKSAPELFDPEILNQLSVASEVRGWEYVQAQQTRARLRCQALERLSVVDVLILPTVPIEAPLIGQRTLADKAGWTTVREALKSFTVPWSLLDLPAISVPVLVHGAKMPGSVQLVGKPGEEQKLLDTAAALEKAVTRLNATSSPYVQRTL